MGVAFLSLGQVGAGSMALAVFFLATAWATPTPIQWFPTLLALLCVVAAAACALWSVSPPPMAATEEVAPLARVFPGPTAPAIIGDGGEDEWEEEEAWEEATDEETKNPPPPLQGGRIAPASLVPGFVPASDGSARLVRAESDEETDDAEEESDVAKNVDAPANTLLWQVFAAGMAQRGAGIAAICAALDTLKADKDKRANGWTKGLCYAKLQVIVEAHKPKPERAR